MHMLNSTHIKYKKIKHLGILDIRTKIHIPDYTILLINHPDGTVTRRGDNNNQIYNSTPQRITNKWTSHKIFHHSNTLNHSPISIFTVYYPPNKIITKYRTVLRLHKKCVKSSLRPLSCTSHSRHLLAKKIDIPFTYQWNIKLGTIPINFIKWY